MAKKIIILSSAFTGYRRAQVRLNQGTNEFPAAQFNETQLAQLKADPKLSVSEIEDKADSSADTQGNVDSDASSNAVNETDNVSVLVELMQAEQFDPAQKKPTVDQLKYSAQPEDGGDDVEVTPTAKDRDAAWTIYTHQCAEQSGSQE